MMPLWSASKAAEEVRAHLRDNGYKAAVEPFDMGHKIGLSVNGKTTKLDLDFDPNSFDGIKRAALYFAENTI